MSTIFTLLYTVYELIDFGLVNNFMIRQCNDILR